MQMVLMLGFVIAYLLVLWLGAIAFEMSGLERRKARFQALSAMTGTGFTTSEAESVVNHPARRRIAAWLIFIGNAGVVGVIVSIVLYVRSGMAPLAWQQAGIIGGVILVIVLLVAFRGIDALTGLIIRVSRRGRPEQFLVTEEVLCEAGDYGVTRIALREDTVKKALTLAGTGLAGRGLTVLAILRGDEVLADPEPAAALRAGDRLLCFGKTGKPGAV